jgi:hypothetical protein
MSHLEEELLRRASDAFAVTPEWLIDNIEDPEWIPGGCYLGLGDWRRFVPVVLRNHWHDLSTETRLALIFAGKESAAFDSKD